MTVVVRPPAAKPPQHYRVQVHIMQTVIPARVKLSIAILDGAKIRPQSYEAFFLSDASCVLGAALEGAYGAEAFPLLRAAPPFQLLTQAYPVLLAPCLLPCPACGMRPEWKISSPPLSNWLIHLNDVHHWKRERIAAEVQKMGL